MASIIPYFELHIRPMFRLIDREHMQSRFDLWSYDAVKTKADDILRTVDQPAEFAMPKKSFGGPWPKGWVDVLKQWIDMECPRLALTKGTYAATRLADGSVRLTAAVPLADGAQDAWIDKEQSVPASADYTVYLRPAPTGETRPPRTHNIVERLPAEVTLVSIFDVDGRHDFPVPAAIA